MNSREPVAPSINTMLFLTNSEPVPAARTTKLSVTFAAAASVELLPVPVTRSSELVAPETFQCGARVVVKISPFAPVDVPIGSYQSTSGILNVYGPGPVKNAGAART